MSWMPATRQVFKNLKLHFKSAPILHHPNPAPSLVLKVDNSNSGIRSVLSQLHGSPARLVFFWKLLEIPTPLHQRIPQWVHCSISSGHSGIQATSRLVQNRFFFATDVSTYGRNCDDCFTSKYSRQLPSGILHTLLNPYRSSSPFPSTNHP